MDISLTTFSELINMELYHAIFLGIIQGITEFLPVSSSAHLMIFSQAMGLSNQRHSFDIFLNIGTLFAIMVFFYPQTLSMIFGAIDFVGNNKTQDREFFLTVFFSSLPTIIIFGIAEVFFDVNFCSYSIISGSLILFAFVLLFCDKMPEEKHHINRNDGILVGIAQIIAIFPGVSRLGACLSMMRYLKYSRLESFKFSMVLSIPIVFGACFLKMIKIFTGKIIMGNWGLVFIGCLFSFLFGIASIALMTSFLNKHTLLPLVVYRIIFALFLCVHTNVF